MTDQLVCLLSNEQASSIVWKDESPDDSVDVDDFEDSDRLFTFQVAKSNEQEENVSARPGFTVSWDVSLPCDAAYHLARSSSCPNATVSPNR